MLAGEKALMPEFEQFVTARRIPEQDWPRSPEVIGWVHRNCHCRYVPEWLLLALGVRVRVRLTMWEG